jgi:hypothetical protein
MMCMYVCMCVCVCVCMCECVYIYIYIHIYISLTLVQLIIIGRLVKYTTEKYIVNTARTFSIEEGTAGNNRTCDRRQNINEQLKTTEHVTDDRILMNR